MIINGRVLKYVEIEKQGRSDREYFCLYRYKEEFEPIENIEIYPDIKDRWYEDFLCKKTILEAKENSAIIVNIERIE